MSSDSHCALNLGLPCSVFGFKSFDSCIMFLYVFPISSSISWDTAVFHVSVEEASLVPQELPSWVTAFGAK